jgi:cation transport ATPase
MINRTGLLSVQVTKRFSESTVSKILDLVENAASKKAPTEKFITKFARYYTPVVVLGAFIIAIMPVILYNIPGLTPMFAHEETFSEWIYKATYIFSDILSLCSGNFDSSGFFWRHRCIFQTGNPNKRFKLFGGVE